MSETLELLEENYCKVPPKGPLARCKYCKEYMDDTTLEKEGVTYSHLICHKFANIQFRWGDF